MKLTEMQLAEFCNAVASKEPAPGGGSVAAMAASMGISLVGMVANLTIGRKKYAEHESLMQEILLESETLREKLVKAIDRDTEAYNAVSAVFSMPKESDEEKTSRATAMQTALKAATEVPFEVMQLCLASLTLAGRAVGTSNTNAASDLGVAAHNLLSGAHGAWMNVLINLSGIKDETFVTEKRKASEEIIAKSEKVAKIIISHTMEII